MQLTQTTDYSIFKADKKMTRDQKVSCKINSLAPMTKNTHFSSKHISDRSICSSFKSIILKKKLLQLLKEIT